MKTVVKRPLPVVLVLCLGLVTVAPRADADPVMGFILQADSVATAGGDDALSPFLQDNAILMGAATAQLLDVAFQVAQQGNADGEAENVAFARRAAELFAAGGGSRVPLELVETYQGWDEAQRKQRARAMALEEEATAARGAGELDKAAKLLDEARALYEAIGDRHSVAVNWGSLGVVHWYTGDMDVVIGDYTKALAARRAVEDRILEGRTLNGLGSAHRMKGEYAAAVDWYQKAIGLRRATGDMAGLGTSLTYLGNVYYITGRLVDARDRYEEALPILEAQGNATQMFDILNSIASLYSDMGRLKAANRTYRRALETAKRADDDVRVIMSRSNLADNYRRSGNFREALDEFNEIEEMVQAQSDSLRTALLHRDRGSTYLQMGELDRAREDLLAYVAISRELPDPTYQMEALTNVGLLYREVGAYERGLEAANRARELAEANANGRAYRDAMALAAELEWQLGRVESSLEKWREVLAQDEYDQAHVSVLGDRVSIGGVLALLGRNQKARETLWAVIPETRAAGLPTLEWDAFLALGHSFEIENPDSAGAHYETALRLIEQAGGRIGGAEVQTGFLSGERRYIYEEVARYYASRSNDGNDDWAARAFHTMERAKARGLLELMERSASGESSSREDELLESLYALDPAADDYAARKRELEAAYVAARRTRIENTLGGLASRVDIADIDAVQDALPKNTVLLEYALGDSTSLLWVIDRKQRRLVEIAARPELTREVERLRAALARPGAGDDALVQSARRLYQQLVAPAADRLEGAKHLLIVPDGVLFELPFEVLLTKEPVQSAAWKEQPFLARAVATTYAPSATVYVQLAGRKHKKDYALDLLAVGNPDFSGLDGDALDPLPFAEEEVASISAPVKKKKRVVLTGAGATESAFKEQLSNGSPRIMHLATHGLVDPLEPPRSSVVLAAGDGEDGYLYTLEILSHPCRPGLVVMSACESARGKLSRGEGVVGLSRAFLASGAGGVVASLWSVSDESTAELMKVFYEKMLRKKRPAGRALQEARIALIDDERFSHPFYWSPFIVTGTDRAPW